MMLAASVVHVVNLTQRLQLRLNNYPRLIDCDSSTSRSLLPFLSSEDLEKQRGLTRRSYNKPAPDLHVVPSSPIDARLSQDKVLGEATAAEPLRPICIGISCFLRCRTVGLSRLTTVNRHDRLPLLFTATVISLADRIIGLIAMCQMIWLPAFPKMFALPLHLQACVMIC